MDINFWQRVDNLLEKKDIARKDLASTVGFDVSNIGKGIKENNIPAADTAVKIAQYLETTVEYLVTGKESNLPVLLKADLDKYHKYSRTIYALDTIPEFTRLPIEGMIKDMSKKYSAHKTEAE